MTTDLIIRKVPEAAATTLKGRAARQGMSLQAYLLDLVCREAITPTTDEWLARVAARIAADDSPIEFSSHEALSFIDDDRL